jgi:hypothetical protein
MQKNSITIAILLMGFTASCEAQDPEASAAAPHFFVDGKITVPDNLGPRFVASHLYFDQVEQTIGGRTRTINIIQSKTHTYSLRSVQFTMLDGTVITQKQLQEALDNKTAILFLPNDSTLHPAIESVLLPNTILMKRTSEPRPRDITIPSS